MATAVVWWWAVVRDYPAWQLASGDALAVVVGHEIRRVRRGVGVRLWPNWGGVLALEGHGVLIPIDGPVRAQLPRRRRVAGARPRRPRSRRVGRVPAAPAAP